MTFPVYFDVLGMKVHAHLAMELVAYSGGFQIYLWLRNRWRKRGVLGAQLPFEQNMWVIVGAVFGALVGSKVLAWAESWPVYWAHRGEMAAWMGGKTIVGGLLGGWMGVEIAKWRLGISRSTGEVFVFPLIFGMAVGRVGCFLTGLTDHTYGVATALPWGVDFGDGVRRHPTQVYEILFLVGWGVVLWRGRKARRHEGMKGWDGRSEEGERSTLNDGEGREREKHRTLNIEHRTSNAEGGREGGRLFRVFMSGYLGMRFLIEFIKPVDRRWMGLSAIQVACVVGMGVCVWQLWGRGRVVDREREMAGVGERT